MSVERTLADILPGTLVAAQQTRRAQTKQEFTSRLTARTETRVDDKKEWATAKRLVWARDGNRCRHTKRKVKKTLELDPLRGEVHHLEPREHKALRYDVRNLLLLSLETHEKVTRHELTIIGTRFFMHAGKRYTDANFRVRFEKVTA